MGRKPGSIRDPAWKHCEKTINSENKTQLKCLYCGKIFLGGGIFRIKEHLAGQKGNGITCTKVLPDVRSEMVDCLMGSSGKKKKSRKVLDDNSPNGEIGPFPMDGVIEEHGSGSGRLKESVDGVECDVVVPLDSNLVVGTRQKRDPAWKHCKMFHSEGKVRLKCIYCGKIFKGGGIFRIKEHLAGKKGNGITCPRVKLEVQREMFEWLNVVSGEKMKKQKVIDFNTSGDDKLENYFYNEPGTSGVEASNKFIGGGNADFDVLPMNELIEQELNDGSSRKDAVCNESNLNERTRKYPDGSDAVVLNRCRAMNSKKASSDVHMAIGRFFFDVGLPMNAVKSAYFQPMIDTIASHGKGAVAPSYNDLRSWILKNSVEEVKTEVNQCREAWGRTGCSILVNELNVGKGKTFVMFLVYCPQGTIFLRSADISHALDSTDVLHELLKETLEEVGVRNVLQVVTNCEDRYVTAGKKLMENYPSVFWTPCAGHCIDLMLNDLEELIWVKNTFDQAKSITRYIYSNGVVLNMMRRYTSGVDLVDLGITSSSTDFMTLKRILSMKSNLQTMLNSEEWMESPYSKTQEGLALVDYIINESFWSACEIITRLTDPLLRLLRIVGSGNMPAMGFVYAGLYRAKEVIKKELVNGGDYLVYWNIIDHRWEQLQWHPLHAAGFYFNPKFFYSLQGVALYHIRSLVYDCIEKIVPEPQIQDKIMKETTSYQGGLGDFGRKMAIRARDTLNPTEWWTIYGGGCPHLTRLAICVLSQNCSLIQYKLKKIPLKLMHEWKNRLEYHRLSDLTFVQYNMSLKQMAMGDREQETEDPISYENIDIVGDWVTEKKLDSDSEGLQNADWMAVDPPLSNAKLLNAQESDVEALGAGFDDHEILNGMKNSEEVNGTYI